MLLLHHMVISRLRYSGSKVLKCLSAILKYETPFIPLFRLLGSFEVVHLSYLIAYGHCWTKIWVSIYKGKQGFSNGDSSALPNGDNSKFRRKKLPVGSKWVILFPLQNENRVFIFTQAYLTFKCAHRRQRIPTESHYSTVH